MKQRSPEWYEARKGKITGSRIGAILGLSPFQTRDDVMRQMVREWHNAEPEFIGNVATQWGVDHEDVARQAYEAHSGHFVEAVGLIQHPDYDFLAVSPDGLIDADGGLEIKCPYSARETGSFKPLDQQPHYQAQIQLVLACCQRKWCDSFFWSQVATKLERMVYDPDWLPQVLPHLMAFHQQFQEIVSSDDLSTPFMINEIVEIDTPEWQEAAEEYKYCQQQKKFFEERANAARQRLLEQCDGLQKYAGCGLTVSYHYRKQFDKAWLAKDYPEIDLNAYMRESEEPTWVVREQKKTG